MYKYLALIAISISVAGSWCAAQPVSDPQPAQAIALSEVVRHIDEAALANREHYRAYEVTRQYRMFGGNEQNPSSEVVAQVNFVPPGTKDFTIVESKGSSRGEGIVRRMLERERKAAADRSALGAVTSANYDFTYLGEAKLDGRDCYLLRIVPRKKDNSLIDGRAWVDKATYLVHEVDGEMSKLPSWWLKSVHVTLNFHDVHGMWMQSATRAVAEVRMFGRHTFVSQDVSYRTSDAVAENTPRPRRVRPTAVLGAAIHDR